MRCPGQRCADYDNRGPLSVRHSVAFAEFRVGSYAVNNMYIHQTAFALRRFNNLVRKKSAVHDTASEAAPEL